MRALKPEVPLDLMAADSLGSGTGASSQFEEKKKMPAPYSGPSLQPGIPMTPIKAAKMSIRKLPMFETYSNGENNYDFEWPNSTVLKGITNVK